MTNRQVLLCGGPRDGYWTTWNDSDYSREIIVPIIPPISVQELIASTDSVSAPSFERIVYTVTDILLFGRSILIGTCGQLDPREETDLIMRSLLQRDVYHVMTRGR